MTPDAKTTKTMKLYIYSLESNQHAATVTGETSEACERVAEETYGSNDFGWTYTPAFGFSDGLIENDEAKEIEV
jgi:protein-disulfide isomerase